MLNHQISLNTCEENPNFCSPSVVFEDIKGSQHIFSFPAFSETEVMEKFVPQFAHYFSKKHNSLESLCQELK